MRRSISFVPSILALGLFSLLTAGCGEPLITQVTPPGVELRPVITEAEAAEAIGETYARQAVAPDAPAPFHVEPAPPTEPGKEVTLPNGLKYVTVKPGTGPAVEGGQSAVVQYTGTLVDGRQFDSSRSTGRPLTFQVGVSKVIDGWHHGIAGMKVGEQRRLTIPPELAYGTQGRDSIPPNSTLIFDIELVEVK
jgi:FKBP-type peptidyl-prolyl cis-trans isomerase